MNLIMRIWDAAPSGKRQLITTGYLKVLHRELDKRTTEGSPYHPHNRVVPVEPGEIEEYVLRLYPFGNTFQPGYRMLVELSNNEPLADEHKVAEQLRTGMVHVNDTTINGDAVSPFGGTGESGNGASYGRASNIDEFTHWQWVTVRETPSEYPF